MTSIICEKCKRVMWSEPHHCPPKWICWTEDDRGEEGHVIYALNEELAAERFVEFLDSESGYEYTDGGRNSVTVFVRESDEEGPPISVTVFPEGVIQYTGYVNKDE